MAESAIDKHHNTYFEMVFAEQHLTTLQDLLYRVTKTNQTSPESEPLVTKFEDIEIVIAITRFGLAKVRWLETRKSLISGQTENHNLEQEAEAYMDVVCNMEKARRQAKSLVRTLRQVHDARAIEPF